MDESVLLKVYIFDGDYFSNSIQNLYFVDLALQLQFQIVNFAPIVQLYHLMQMIHSEFLTFLYSHLDNALYQHCSVVPIVGYLDSVFAAFDTNDTLLVYCFFYIAFKRYPL